LASKDSRFSVSIGGSREFDPRRGQRLKRSYRSGEIHTSSLGTLGRDFSPARAPGSFRVVVLGDSCAFMPPARPWPSVLEERLRARLGRDSIEVVDAACPGYDSSQARSWYEDEVSAWEHDALVIAVGWNDVAQFHPAALRGLPARPLRGEPRRDREPGARRRAERLRARPRGADPRGRDRGGGGADELPAGHGQEDR